MGKTKTTPFNVAEHLRTPEEVVAYLEACLEDADLQDVGNRQRALSKRCATVDQPKTNEDD